MPLHALTIEDYRKIAIEKNHTYILDTIPKNTCTRAEAWQCPNGNIVTLSYSNFKVRKICLHCTGRHVKKINDYHKLAESNNGKYILETIPAHTNDIAENAWECDNGHIWSASYTKISSAKSWCPPCFRERQKHGDDKYHELAKRFGMVYVKEDESSKLNVNLPVKWKCIKHPDIIVTSPYHRMDFKRHSPCDKCKKDRLKSTKKEKDEDVEENEEGEDEVNEESNEEINEEGDESDHNKENTQGLADLSDQENVRKDKNLSLYEVAEICRPSIYANLLEHNEMKTLKDFIEHIGLNEDLFRVDEFWDGWNSPDKWLLVNEEMIDWYGYEGEYRNKKQKFIQLVKKNFEENIDYKYSDINDENYGVKNEPKKRGVQEKIIFITYLCSKKISMMLSTKKLIRSEILGCVMR